VSKPHYSDFTAAYFASPYAAYTVEIDGEDYTFTEEVNIELIVKAVELINDGCFAMDDGRIIRVSPIIPHLTGQRIYGEDTPEVREMILPQCLAAVEAIVRGGGVVIAITKYDGTLSNGTQMEVDHARSIKPESVVIINFHDIYRRPE